MRFSGMRSPPRRRRNGGVACKFHKDPLRLHRRRPFGAAICPGAARDRCHPDDRGHMAKLIMMRWVLGIATVSAAVLVIAIAWQSASSGVGRVSSATSAADQSDFARRRDELRFLQAAFDRLDAESRQDPNGPALRSLRAEQDAIVLQMREVARPLPADSLPPALRHLATAEPRSAAEPALPANPAQASASPAASPIPVAASRELRAGLGAA